MTEETTVKPKDLSLAALAIAGGLTVALVALILFMENRPAPVSRHALACEAALASRLLAPSGMKRQSLTEDGGKIYVEFDAPNAYGTAVRHSGHCRFDLAQRGFALQEISLDGRKLEDLDFIEARLAITRAFAAGRL